MKHCMTFLFLVISCLGFHQIIPSEVCLKNQEMGTIEKLNTAPNLKKYIRSLSSDEKKALWNALVTECYAGNPEEIEEGKEALCRIGEGRWYFEVIRQQMLYHSLGKTPTSLKAMAILAAHRHKLFTKKVVSTFAEEIESYCRDVVCSIKNAWTILNKAILDDDIDLVRLALKHGARSFEFDELWRSPLHFAACKGNTDIVLALLADTQVSGSLRDSFCCTPSDCAAIYGHTELAALLKLYCWHDKEPPSPLHVAAAWNAIDKVKQLRNTPLLNSRNRKGQTPLQCAVRAGNLEAARLLREAGAQDSAHDNKKESPLHQAALAGNTKILKMLLDSPKKEELVKARNKKGETPLHCAARKSSQCVDLLLKAGAEVDAVDLGGETSLMRAACFDQIGSVRRLLASGASTKKVENREKTVLHIAAFGGSSESIKLFLTLGCLANCLDDQGNSPLHDAMASHDEPVCVSLLIEAGADKDVRNDSGITPTMKACYWGMTKSLKMLLSYDTDCTVADNGGRTAVHYAVEPYNVDCLKLLADKKAPLDCLDKFKRTPLFVAVEKKRGPCIDFLLNQGCEPNVHGGDEGDTLVTLACRNEDFESLKKLYHAKADITLKDNKGNAPIHHTAYTGNDDCMAFLLDKGVDVNVLGEEECSLLILAASRGYIKCVRLLLAAGADKCHTCIQGLSALVLAAFHGRTECRDILLENEDDLASHSLYGSSLLHFAALINDSQFIEVLLKKGMDPNMLDSKEQTPLHVAAEAGCTLCIRLLLYSGALIDAVDKKGKTPIQLARSKGHMDCVDMLESEVHNKD